MVTGRKACCVEHTDHEYIEAVGYVQTCIGRNLTINEELIALRIFKQGKAAAVKELTRKFRR